MKMAVNHLGLCPAGGGSSTSNWCYYQSYYCCREIVTEYVFIFSWTCVSLILTLKNFISLIIFWMPVIAWLWKIPLLVLDFGVIIYSTSFIPQFLSKRLSKAHHSASKDSGHAGARDIVSIQELYPFCGRSLPQAIFYFIIYLQLHV